MFIEEIDLGEEDSVQDTERVDRLFSALKAEDAEVAHRAVVVHSCSLVHTVMVPSPVRRSAALRVHRRASPTWIDGLYAEMKEQDAERTRKRNEEEAAEEAARQSKRTRWTVDEVENALQHCDLNKNACTALGAWCPPQPPLRLQRWERKQAARQAARKQQTIARRRCRGEVDLSALEQSLSSVLVTSE